MTGGRPTTWLVAMAGAVACAGAAEPPCDPGAFDCGASGDPTAEAGDACQVDAQCEEGGACRTERRLSTGEGEVVVFPGGSCFGPVCFADADCNGEGRCGGGRAGAFLTGSQNVCLAPCDLAVGADPEDASTWPAGRGGCNAGYKCLSSAGVGSPGRGVCVPDRLDPFRDAATPVAPFGSGPRTPNLGAPCTRPDACFHPFGYGRCLRGANGRDGICSVDEAGLLEASGYAVCGDAGAIVGLALSVALEQRCLPRCNVPADCAAGFACIPRGTGRVCAPTGCTGDVECRAGTRCLEGACHVPCTTAAGCDTGLGCVALRALGGAGSERVCFAGCMTNADCRGDARCDGATATTLGRCLPR